MFICKVAFCAYVLPVGITVTGTVRSRFCERDVYYSYLIFIRNNRITSKKSRSCTTAFSACLTSLTVLPPQSRDYSCYVSGPILTPPPLWMQKRTDLRAPDFAHSPDLWRQLRLANLTCAWTWRLWNNSFCFEYRSRSVTSKILTLIMQITILLWPC